MASNEKSCPLHENLATAHRLSSSTARAGAPARFRFPPARAAAKMPRLPAGMKRAHLYIVQCADGTLYTGIAADVARRVKLHNTGKGAKYTRSRGPVAVVYREGPMSRSRALRRECQVKRLTRAQKQALIAGRLRLARPR